MTPLHRSPKSSWLAPLGSLLACALVWTALQVTACSWVGERKLAARENLSDCETFEDADKRAWCEGRCDLVDNLEYRGMCERFQLRRK